MKEWWEGVRELQNHGSTNEGTEITDLGHSSGDDESKDPVRWYKYKPDPLASAAFKSWESQELTADIGVENLDTNVTVEHSGDESGEQIEGIANSLPGVVADALW
jgi:hypothetical protein